jgi:hypothetical protein
MRRVSFLAIPAFYFFSTLAAMSRKKHLKTLSLIPSTFWPMILGFGNLSICNKNGKEITPHLNAFGAEWKWQKPEFRNLRWFNSSE